jgi:REP element-mobilizing transposase RayT
MPIGRIRPSLSANGAASYQPGATPQEQARQQTRRANGPFQPGEDQNHFRRFTMPQSLSLVVIHVIFSTKDRLPQLDDGVRPRLHAYLATIARNTGCEAYRVGGVADHVHFALQLSRTVTIADLIEELKTSSSKWLKTQSPELSGFTWQRGYGCFSVGPTDLESLCTYISGQEEHHRTRTFQEEFRMLLAKYKVEYDEAYVWD